MRVAWASRLEERDAEAYDALVAASPAGHFAQTRAWAEVARRRALVTARFALVRDDEGGAAIGAAMVLRSRVAGAALPWAWVDRGPVVMRVDDLERVTSAIARRARERGVVRLRVMPYWADDDAEHAERQLRAAGFRDAQQADGAHARTLRIAIAGTNETRLFAGKTHEQVRWRARQAERLGASVRRATVRDCVSLGAPPALCRFVAEEARGAAFACDLARRTVSACIVVRHGPHAVYVWSGAIAGPARFSKAVLPLVEAIRWARRAGCATFDLGGIPMEGDRDAKRNAIATFKRDFARSPVRLVREHARWLLA